MKDIVLKAIEDMTTAQRNAKTAKEGLTAARAVSELADTARLCGATDSEISKAISKAASH